MALASRRTPCPSPAQPRLHGSLSSAWAVLQLSTGGDPVLPKLCSLRLLFQRVAGVFSGESSSFKAQSPNDRVSIDTLNQVGVFLLLLPNTHTPQKKHQSPLSNSSSHTEKVMGPPLLGEQSTVHHTDLATIPLTGSLADPMPKHSGTFFPTGRPRVSSLPPS